MPPRAGSVRPWRPDFRGDRCVLSGSKQCAVALRGVLVAAALCGAGARLRRIRPRADRSGNVWSRPSTPRPGRPLPRPVWHQLSARHGRVPDLRRRGRGDRRRDHALSGRQRLDPHEHGVVARPWSRRSPGRSEPTGISVDPAGGRLWIATTSGQHLRARPRRRWQLRHGRRQPDTNSGLRRRRL